MPNHHSSLLWTLPLFLSISLLSATPHFQEEESTPITRFQQYLRINTAHPNPDYSSAISFLQSQSHSLNLQTQILYFFPTKPLLLLTWPGSNPSLPSILLNSHLDSVPAEPSKWAHHPFSAFRSPSDGKIFARGAQDDKCIGLQYLEAIRILKNDFNFEPSRTVHILYVPDEEIGGFDGMAAFVKSKVFGELDLGFMLDEGQASVNEHYRVFYADRSPWHMVIKAVGMPGHGSRMYDDSAMENLMKSIEVMSKFRENQFDLVKAGWADHSDVISVNPVYLKAGIASPAGFVMNMQPSEAEAGFDIRFSPTTDSNVLKKRIADEWAPAARNMTFEGFVMNMQPSEAEAGFDIRFSPTTDSNVLKKRIADEWAPAARNITFEITEKGPLRDYLGRPLMTHTNDSNPWWSVFKQAIEAAGGKLSKPEILSSTTDARFIRQLGIPALGFSPMKNTPILLHDHNEFLKDTVYLEGIKIYVSIIRSLSSFEEGSASL